MSFFNEPTDEIIIKKWMHIFLLLGHNFFSLSKKWKCFFFLLSFKVLLFLSFDLILNWCTQAKKKFLTNVVGQTVKHCEHIVISV